MSKKVETALRAPQAYALARNVIGEMEKAGVWPTPLNFELWLHYISDPDGPLAQEIRRLLAQSAVITDKTSEMLAAEFLPRGRLPDQIRDVGAVLDRELASVASAIAMAHKTQHDYGETLADASQCMETVDDPSSLKDLVGGLSTATNRVRRETAILEKRLEKSNKEVIRLRENLEQVRRDAMTDALTEPTSVTTPLVLCSMACTPSMTCDTGVATNEISALASTPQLSMMPRESASASRPLPASLPETCQPDARRPAATEPPMRPSPRTFARLVTTFQRTASERTSWVVSSRHSPGFNVASTRVPMRVRTSRFTSCPTASHMRRTCR